MIPVIAIDGPSGSGKGTVSRRVASTLGWHLLDSGALYRLVALAGARAGLDPQDEAGHAEIAAGLDVVFRVDDRGEERVLLGGREVSGELRSEATGAAASRVAAWPVVRTALLGRQRRFMQPPGLVADGRDMGSVVFPDAGLKLFLTATPEERALRRHKQLNEKGLGVNLAALSAEIAERDRRDATRKVAPLVACPDAVVLDTTSMGIDAVVNRVLALAYERLPGAHRED
ncbi:MAG TPA: (d)CMP kinase [Vicinamibacterales bacterium]|nr:(d)CMP kinase [Vicinamibacterales bacterium]